MDLGLNEQQEMLRRTARDFLEAECPTTLVRELESSDKGYSPELWRKMADLGWLGLAFPGEYGGAGGSLVDEVVLFEEIGRAIVPGPMLTSTVLSGQTVLNAAGDEQKSSLLRGIARGDTILSAALTETGADHAGIRAEKAEGSYVINGTSMFVPYAHVASHLVVVAGTGGGQASAQFPDGSTLFLIETSSPGISCIPMESVAGYKQFEVSFQDVRVPEGSVIGQVGLGRAPLAKALEWATVVQCGEMVGRAQKVLDMVVEYAKVRVQFGRPIGSFQAVQHHCADLKVAVDGARLVTYGAAWKLSEGLPCGEDIAIAKAYTGDVSRLAVAVGHGIFAGIAFTVEHDMQLYTLRSKIAEANLGDADFHLDRLAAHMGM